MLQNLKLLRNQTSISQQELATEVGVSQQSINKYENHNVEPDIKTLIAIADYFNVSVDYLIGRTDENSPTPASSTYDNICRKCKRLKKREMDYIEVVINAILNMKNR